MKLSENNSTHKYGKKTNGYYDAQQYNKSKQFDNYQRFPEPEQVKQPQRPYIRQHNRYNQITRESRLQNRDLFHKTQFANNSRYNNAQSTKNMVMPWRI